MTRNRPSRPGWVPIAKMVFDWDDQNYTNIMSIVSVSERNTVRACIDLKRKFVWFYRAFSDTFKSKRKAMNRNWYNQKANPALNTKAGNK